MVKLVDDLLNVSRIETGRLKIDPQVIDLIVFIEDIIKELAPWANEFDCRIVFNKPDVKLPQLKVDKTMFRQVVHNLITNAIRYSPASSEVNVEINIKNKEFTVSVGDKGIGIPKESQARIFNKFFRAENARIKETEGSGLGLYISKMIMEQSGGRIWFESPTMFRDDKAGNKEGYGTTFYVSLPLEGMKAQDGEKGLAGGGS